MSRVPPFSEEFLHWVREHTERAWARAEPRTLEDFEAAGVGGVDWQQGTRWQPLREEEIAQIEAREGHEFPPDHRMFLRVLHATAPPMAGALFQGQTLRPAVRAGFYDWRVPSDVQGAREDVVRGIAFDVEQNAVWRDEWGARPASEEARIEVVRAQVAAAPRLLPLFGHRYLVGDPCRVGNPVLSIHQTDIIVYGRDLRSYLLNELHRKLGVEPDFATPPPDIPFWGNFL